MAFFAGDDFGHGAHDDLAKEIAMAGKEWAEKHWCACFCSLCTAMTLMIVFDRRWVDMEVYMYRLLLEVSRGGLFCRGPLTVRNRLTWISASSPFPGCSTLEWFTVRTMGCKRGTCNRPPSRCVVPFPRRLLWLALSIVVIIHCISLVVHLLPGESNERGRER